MMSSVDQYSTSPLGAIVHSEMGHKVLLNPGLNTLQDTAESSCKPLLGPGQVGRQANY